MMYLQDMRREQGLQLDWMEKSGQMRAKAARKQGSYIAQSAQSQGYIGGSQAFGNAAGYASNIFGAPSAPSGGAS